MPRSLHPHVISDSIVVSGVRTAGTMFPVCFLAGPRLEISPPVKVSCASSAYMVSVRKRPSMAHVHCNNGAIEVFRLEQSRIEQSRIEHVIIE